MQATDQGRARTFLHLSDIHFHDWGPDYLDTDRELRTALADESVRMARDFGPLDGILVTGDIAFKGDAAEYAEAASWLTGLLAEHDLPPSAVWAVPGNHDVAWNLIDDSHGAERRLLRSATQTSLATAIRKQSSFFEAPFEAYIKFAATYGCIPQRADGYWQYPVGNENPLVLTDGRVLRLFGINTALLCGKRPDLDCPSEQRGEINFLETAVHLPLPSADSRFVNVLLGHHPPSWWYHDEIQPLSAFAENRAHIQLYGHTHAPEIYTVGASLVVQAGAVNPPRLAGPAPADPWRPSFSMVAIDSPIGGGGIHVRVSQRAWDTKRTCYTSRGEDVNGWFIIDPLLRGHVAHAAPDESPPPQAGDPEATPSEVAQPADSWSPRELFRQIMLLPSAKYERIFKRLGYTPGDSDLANQLGMPYYIRSFREILNNGRHQDLFEAMRAEGIPWTGGTQ